MKRSVIDTKFGGPTDQEVLCSSAFRTPKEFQQYFRWAYREDPWLSYRDHGDLSSLMYGEAGECARVLLRLCCMTSSK